MRQGIEKGDLYRVALHGRGHELDGPHYGVVVSDEAYNHLSTVVVVPLSSRAGAEEFHPETAVRGTRTRALVEQVVAIDRGRLREYIDSLAGTAAMALIDEQLMYLFALD